MFFDYQEGRGRDEPMEILQNFRGYLQTDGLAVYDVFDRRPGITQIHCMVHARRMFHEALDNDRIRAEYVIQEIQKLYVIERSCKEQSPGFDEIKTIRQTESVAILAALGRWMKDEYMQSLAGSNDIAPKSNIGKALAYSVQRWETLSRYTENGMLNIDINPVERSIRPVAIGRKNYLFAGSHQAAKRSSDY